MQQNQDKETIYQKQEKIIKIKQPNACKKAQKDQNFHILGIRVAKQLKRLVMNILKDQKGKENCGRRGKLQVLLKTKPG